ncbi:hypothetical protein [Kitasatospora camelliae]|uniref:Secreted protein with PEP-CTERM sorting signal n=1 Tax=Kitasatospora camelliae TaxID=3156397 RepID=A0AAU8JVT8_9ACTN
MHETDRTGGDEELPGDGTAKSGPTDQQGAAPARRPSAGSQAEQDAIFAELVARFDDPVDLTDPEWPEVENLRAQTERSGHDEGGRTAPEDGLADLAPQPRPRPNGPIGGQVGGPAAGPRDYELTEDPDEGHFVPPEPPPLPPADTAAKFAWLAVLGGPSLLLFDAVVWHEVAGWPAWVGMIAFLGGIATLVARMKDRDEDEPEDPNGGAVV